jgi:type I restriction enzyme S subunit
LGDLFDITSSKRVFESDWKREGVPFYRAREIVKLAQQGFVDNELFISEEMFSQYSTKYGIPAEGDIMVTGVGTLGICYVVQKHDRFYFKDGNIIWLKKKSEADSSFVEYAFKSDFLRKQIDDSVGATVGTYTIVKAKNTQIPIPSLPEQQRIVGMLDEAFDGIAIAKVNAEKNLQNARALFESHIQSVFARRGKGWVEQRIGDVGKTQYGLSVPMNDNGKGFKIFRMGEVQDGRLIDTGRMKFADINGAEFEKYKLQPGDVLFNRTNSFELVGKTGIFDMPGDYCFASYLVRVLLNKKVMLSEFLNHFMNSKSFQNSVKQKASKSINQANINATILSNESVRFPESLKEQETIVARLDSLREETQHLESLYKRKLDALEALRKSLLHQVFTGKL